MGGHRVLIVEDHPSTREALVRIFAAKGWDVCTAATLEEGLECLDPPPDCVVLDLNLPDGAGETVLRKVRAEGLPIRVFVYTASYDPVRLSSVSSIGPDAVFLKPTGFAELLLALGPPT
jgi:DNA-binding response OmpR family regulator